MIDTRLKKVIRDLWFDRGRALIVVMAITIGIFAFGSVIAGYSILDREMNANYMNTNPPSAILWVDQVDGNLIKEVKSTGLVADAEARRIVIGRMRIGPEEWRTIWLFVIDDYDSMRIATVHPEEESWPPKKGEILVERAAVPFINTGIGGNITVKTPNGIGKELRVVGTLHDPAQAPANMEGIVYGYITPDTLGYLGETPVLDQLMITVTRNATDEAYIRSTAFQLKDQIEKKGIIVKRIEVPSPGEHPHSNQMGALMFLFEAFGLLSFILSAILAANMINGLLSQQVRQIGIMKTIGATTGQIIGMYFAGVFFLGLVAILIAVPTSVFAGRALSTLVAGILNFDIASYEIPYRIFILVIGVGLLVPLVATAYPIIRGSQITVQQAINDYGINSESRQKKSLLDSALERVPRLSRPLMLSVRNTFRKKGRMALTMLTLAIGGALFIVAMNLGASIDVTVDNAFDTRQISDIVIFADYYPTENISRNLASTPGIARAECMANTMASFLTNADGTESNQFTVLAIPPELGMINYPIIEGRWLQPGDENAVVLNHMLVGELKKHGIVKDIKAGDNITLNINGNRSTWRVAGIAREMMAPSRAYINYDYYTSIAGRNGLANYAVVSMADAGSAKTGTPMLSFSVHGMNISLGTKTEKAEDYSDSITPLIERELQNSGLNVSTISSINEMRRSMKEHLAVIAAFLTFLSVLIVIVGALGMASTMNINVTERRRELGVMRTIGASAHAIYRILATEALMIGLLSWFLAVLIAPPLSVEIGNIFGAIFFKSPLDIAFSPVGMALWLLIVVILSPAASLLSARKALRQPVHEVLAYE
ncbi:MAG: ABC transporter permease [Methanosarcina sp.]